MKNQSKYGRTLLQWTLLVEDINEIDSMRVLNFSGVVFFCLQHKLQRVSTKCSVQSTWRTLFSDKWNVCLDLLRKYRMRASAPAGDARDAQGCQGGRGYREWSSGRGLGSDWLPCEEGPRAYWPFSSACHGGSEGRPISWREGWQSDWSAPVGGGAVSKRRSQESFSEHRTSR